MADELELDLESEEESITRKDKRLKSLSDKVKEKEDALLLEAEAKKKAETDRDNATRERDFYKGFNQVSSKHPAAAEYQDKIWEKVKGGYDIEDATVSILAKEGKYTSTQPKVETTRAAGGSAATSMNASDSKSPQEMTQAERKASLQELEAKGELHL